MPDFTPLVLFATAVTLALGLAVARLGYRAYRRTDLAGLRSLSAALVLVVAGSALGAADQLLGVDAALAGLAGSVVTATGFVVLAVALYGSDRPRPERRAHDEN
ncbi:DUF7521 family protein [Halobacterium jilantaiense]|uniref:Uncharacterized protein n=1 Tax=Halobacterium jilantaiense TaxID=355548 RepID=A0A1I0QSV6_9EURY|nr:hypothetical protein [Halobacterium jilantaiense]SEW30412.1 hypothetical protein SAMN04487945_2922 [Halobacterium jilantaiense]